MEAAAVAAQRGGNARFATLGLQHIRIHREPEEASGRSLGLSACMPRVPVPIARSGANR
jgi:hypothetical protein